MVCLGSSAGGLKALEEFLSHVPEKSGLVFVLVSHTDPDRASLLPDILGRKSAIPINTVQKGMQPEQNRVYLPPSNRDVLIEAGTFHLKERVRKDGLHMPIDLFLESLAKAWGERSGCVILSGTGTDGTQGLRLIKEAGGELPAGRPNLEVTGLAREGLRFALTAALRQAVASKKEARQDRIRVKTNSEFQGI